MELDRLCVYAKKVVELRNDYDTKAKLVYAELERLWREYDRAAVGLTIEFQEENSVGAVLDERWPK